MPHITQHSSQHSVVLSTYQPSNKICYLSAFESTESECNGCAVLLSILGGAEDEWKSQLAGCQKGIAACGADRKHMETRLTPGKR